MSYCNAERVSNGYTWAYLRPSPRMDGTIERSQKLGVGRVPVPTIPDKSLGWEVDLGCKWKLLERLTMDATVGYWRPGRWFNYACINRGVRDWGIHSLGNSFGINPNRDIDPIWGMDLLIMIDF